MKVEIGQAILKNLVKLFDEDGDGRISLIEFEKIMSKHIDTGEVEVPKVDEIDSKKISKETKEELVEELKEEQK